MDFKELHKMVVENALNYGQKYNVKIDEDLGLLKLSEEIGELVQAMLIHSKKCRPEQYVPAGISKRELAAELADVVGMTIVNAYLLGINLEKTIKKNGLIK